MTTSQNTGTRHTLKGFLHTVSLKIEDFWDSVRLRETNGEPSIDAYVGYGTPDGTVVHGRILSQHRYSTQLTERSRWNAVRNMVRNFWTKELVDVRVRVGEVEAKSDEEGYFHLLVPAMQPGEHQVVIDLPDYDVQTSAHIIVPNRQASFGIISDIDDTVMRTGAHNLALNLWTTATTFLSDREVFQDTAQLLRQLHDGTNPVFYVSSSPWNLHAYLTSVFTTHNVPRGPLFLRDMGLSPTKFVTDSHGSHKGQAIDTILAANPTLDFVLIGDSGQHDAVVYREAIERHPGRIRQVILRTAGKIDDADRQAAEAIRVSNVDLHTGADLSALLQPDNSDPQPSAITDQPKF